MKKNMKKIVWIVLALCLFVVPGFGSSALDFEQITPSNKKVTYERLIMQNEQQKELDVDGAGCQWPVSLESSNDGSFFSNSFIP